MLSLRAEREWLLLNSGIPTPNPVVLEFSLVVQGGWGVECLFRLPKRLLQAQGRGFGTGVLVGFQTKTSISVL